MPCRSIPATKVGLPFKLAVAGVPMNVRLPPLKFIGDVPVLVSRVVWPLPTTAGLRVIKP